MSKIQNSDVKSEAELITAGATASSLIHDSKIYVTASGINKTLDDAIIDGDIGGAGASVIDSIADGDTANAPSRNAVFDALALKANLASPALTGNPTAPTQAANNNSTLLATTAYADNAVSSLSISANRIATITDVKATNVDGGSSVASAWTTRVLNTLSDPFGIVTSLSANQFVLPAGQYYIESSSPVLGVAAVSYARSKIRNVTAGTNAILGMSGSLAQGGSDGGYFTCPLAGYISIAGATTFSLQYYTTLARATTGLGAAVADGASEVYSIVKITKIA